MKIMCFFYLITIINTICSIVNEIVSTKKCMRVINLRLFQFYFVWFPERNPEELRAIQYRGYVLYWKVCFLLKKIEQFNRLINILISVKREYYTILLDKRTSAEVLLFTGYYFFNFFLLLVYIYTIHVSIRNIIKV